jgi:orotate phosphoribosyltransferase
MRGGRAARAAAILEKNGYKVMGLCGLVDYKEKGYDLVKPAPVK